jgi:hypothetical protein
MSEAQLQRALMHLYWHVHEYDCYSDELFSAYELSESDKACLRELMFLHRPGLVAFSQQLRHKQVRYIRHALPKSAALLGRESEGLLGGYAANVNIEGAEDPSTAVRSFFEHVDLRLRGRSDRPIKLEFIRFEAAYGSLALSSPATRSVVPDPAAAVFPKFRFPGSDSILIGASYDVAAVLKDLVALPQREDQPRPHRFLLFRSPKAGVRVVRLSPELHRALEMLHEGWTSDEIFEELPSDAARGALTACIFDLWAKGVPFIEVPAASANCRGGPR